LILALALPAVAAEPQWDRLYSRSADAGSFLKSNWNKYTENYHPSYALDGNAATAWVEGVDGDGVGQVLAWDVSALSSARSVKLRIRNGYQKSEALLAANAAPKAVTVRVWRGRDLVAETKATLARTMGWQDLVIDTGGKGLNRVELVVDSVHAGSKYKDTCVSDVETWVDSDVPYSAALEAAKKAELDAWVKERVETAAYFAALPPTFPFTATEWRSTTEPATLAEYQALAAPFDAAIARMDAKPLSDGAMPSLRTGPWFAATLQASAPRTTPDGLADLSALIPYVRSADFALFEAKDRLASQQKKQEDDYSRTDERTNLRIERDAAGAVRWAAFETSMERTSERDGESEFVLVLMQYDDRGQLALGSVVRHLFVGCPIDESSVIQPTWTDGRISRLTVTTSGSACGRETVERVVYTP
jgi:hypothetical protein